MAEGAVHAFTPSVPSIFNGCESANKPPSGLGFGSVAGVNETTSPSGPKRVYFHSTVRA